MKRILIQFLFCYTIAIAIASQNNFSINKSKSVESIVLSKLVGNFLIKYFSDEPNHISIVVSNIKAQKGYFQDDFLTNFLTEVNFSVFDYNVNDRIQSNITHNHVFNLILFDNYESLRYVES